MKYGRINERNTGYHKLDGGAKRCKPVFEPVLTDEQREAMEAVKLCNRILTDGIRLYDNPPEIIMHWIKNGIVEVKEIDNPWSYARQFYPKVRMAFLVENHRNDIVLVKSILTTTYKLLP